MSIYDPSTWDNDHISIAVEGQHKSFAGIQVVIGQLLSLGFDLDGVLPKIGIIVGSLPPAINRQAIAAVPGVLNVQDDSVAGPMIARAKSDAARLPMPVRVWAGDGKTLLGDGTYVSDVSVNFMVDQDGNLQSLANAEDPIDPANVPAGCHVTTVPNNPKIVMGDGSIKYGCQVYWKSIAEIQQEEAARAAQKEAVKARGASASLSALNALDGDGR